MAPFISTYGTVYALKPFPTLRSSDLANPTTNPTATTLYTVTVTDANGCKNTAATSVKVNPLPVVTVNQPSTYIGASAHLTHTDRMCYLLLHFKALSNPNIAHQTANPT